MTSVSIPLAVLDAPAYQSLPAGDKMFLIDLYALFSDCERFSIDMDRPADYRQRPGVHISRRLHALIDAGMLVLDGAQNTGPGRFRRVFKFTHPSILEQA